LDVVKQLEEGKVSSLDNWLWQKQLRFYLNSKQRALVRMADAEFAYSYEYLGNVEKLVHTPLSDKCYLVLTQGMHLGYGGCPYGPAGTGKTESVKALANAFGRLRLGNTHHRHRPLMSLSKLGQGGAAHPVVAQQHGLRAQVDSGMSHTLLKSLFKC
jgi:hypothetical protein